MKLIHKIYLGAKGGEPGMLILQPTRRQSYSTAGWNEGELAGDIIARHTESTSFLVALHNVIHEEIARRRLDED
jgi:hypothetical protein